MSLQQTVLSPSLSLSCLPFFLHAIQVSSCKVSRRRRVGNYQVFLWCIQLKASTSPFSNSTRPSSSIFFLLLLSLYFAFSMMQFSSNFSPELSKLVSASSSNCVCVCVWNLANVQHARAQCIIIPFSLRVWPKWSFGDGEWRGNSASVAIAKFWPCTQPTLTPSRNKFEVTY